MTTTAWRRVLFENAKTHTYPAQYEALLIADLTARQVVFEHGYDATENPHPVTEWQYDQGGMWVIGQPVDQFALDGLIVRVPCDHAASALGTWKRTRLRWFANGTPYYKLHGFRLVLVLTPAMFHALGAELEARVASAHDRAEAFFRERQARRDSCTRGHDR